jgi:hypothetical protein
MPEDSVDTHLPPRFVSENLEDHNFTATKRSLRALLAKSPPSYMFDNNHLFHSVNPITPHEVQIQLTHTNRTMSHNHSQSSPNVQHKLPTSPYPSPPPATLPQNPNPLPQTPHRNTSSSSYAKFHMSLKGSKATSFTHTTLEKRLNPSQRSSSTTHRAWNDSVFSDLRMFRSETFVGVLR